MLDQQVRLTLQKRIKMNKLKNLQDIVSYEYDGCYEVMQEVIKAYSKAENSRLDFNDLDLVLMIPIGTWSISTDKKKELLQASHLDEEAKTRLTQLIDNVQQKAENKEYIHNGEGKYSGCWGMFGTGFRSVSAVCDDINTARDFISLLVSTLTTNEDKLFGIVDATIKSKKLSGLQTGVISQVLHCLYPTTFPILNSWGREIFNALRLRLIKADKKDTYISNCKTIKKYRDTFADFKNYRTLDCLKIEDAREIGFGFFVEKYSAPNAILNDIDTILPKYISKMTDNYHTLYQIPDADETKEVQRILRANSEFMKKSEATAHHRPSSCFKKYADFFSWWINPADPFAQSEVAYDEDDESDEVRVYDFTSDIDRPFISEEKFNEIVALLRRKKNVILEGAPGVGKTFLARKVAYQLMGEAKDENIEMVQFHQSYSYEDFVQGIRPMANGEFKTRDGVFYEFCAKALTNPKEKYVFIIDEINRGNLSKILGELMMLIEANKRSPRYAIKLTYSDPDDEKFYVPDNVYILGCMNTADRSLSIVDYALRRRFAFFTIEPEFGKAFCDFLTQKFDDDFVTDICKRLIDINELIKQHPSLGKGMEIGHSYFCEFKEASDAEIWWQNICKYELVPYLREICFDDDDLLKELCKRLTI